MSVTVPVGTHVNAQTEMSIHVSEHKLVQVREHSARMHVQLLLWFLIRVLKICKAPKVVVL